MSMAQFLALLLCVFCLAALLLGLYRPSWVLPFRRATRVQVVLLYSAAGMLGPLLAGEWAHRAAHAQRPGMDLDLGRDESAGSASLHLNEREPEAESLRALANRVLLGLGFGPGHRLRIGRLSLTYEDPVTEEQALALGEFLSRSEVGGDRDAGSGPGSGSGQIQVQLHRAVAETNTRDSYELRIATSFSQRQQLDPETKAAYQMIGLLASGIAFDGAPVHVQVCTALFRPLLILHPQLGSAVATAP